MELDDVAFEDKRYRDFGTYLKVVKSGAGDAFIALYLRPDGRFLFLGYWVSNERTAAAGVWTKAGKKISLRGIGVVAADSELGGKRLPFERTFDLHDNIPTPSISADHELVNWSLLSWSGPFQYVGKATVFNPDGLWLPDSLRAVDGWIDRLTV